MTKRGLLLDTCAWIWLVEGHSRLKKSRTLGAIEEAAENHALYLCPISVWEVCIKASSGKLQFSMPVFDWISQSKRKAGLQNTILSDDIMHKSTILPGQFHSDPADRMIVATALQDQLRLVTGDEKILTWAKDQKIQILAV